MDKLGSANLAAAKPSPVMGMLHRVASQGERISDMSEVFGNVANQLIGEELQQAAGPSPIAGPPFAGELGELHYALDGLERHVDYLAGVLQRFSRLR